MFKYQTNVMNVLHIDIIGFFDVESHTNVMNVLHIFVESFIYNDPVHLRKTIALSTRYGVCIS